MAYALTATTTDRYWIVNGDCMDVLAQIPDASIGGSIYSPPFAGLYHYSSDERDFSNARDYEEFLEMYAFLIAEKYRVTMPGRTSGVHAAPVPTSNSGRDALNDFPGDVIRLHQNAGWDFIARHVIWKEPLAIRNRTMQKNLSHQTVVNDGALGGVASGDELLIFRKPGTNPDPVDHPTGFTNDYAGEEQPPHEIHQYRGWDGDQKANRYSHWTWRRYASCVWDDIRLGRVLPFRDSKDPDDEKHVHPLQLDVIERYLDLRTKPGDKVLTPFMGVGSEVWSAVRMGRFAVGAELKESYYKQALMNLAHVDDELDSAAEDDLLSLIEAES